LIVPRKQTSHFNPYIWDFQQQQQQQQIIVPRFRSGTKKTALEQKRLVIQ
jgi:hypothetical protein